MDRVKEWLTEPDQKKWVDETTKYHIEIVRNSHSGALCGYVNIPPGHPCFDSDYDHELLDSINVHGGVTYAEPASTFYWRFGFDCAHAGDFMPVFDGITVHESYTVYRNMDYVTTECESLAKQLFQITQEQK